MDADLSYNMKSKHQEGKIKELNEIKDYIKSWTWHQEDFGSLFEYVASGKEMLI